MPVFRGKWVPRWKYELLRSSEAQIVNEEAEAASIPAQKPPKLRKVKEPKPDAES